MWIYTGGAGGRAFFPGIPARDLTNEEAEKYKIKDLPGEVYLKDEKKTVTEAGNDN